MSAKVSYRFLIAVVLILPSLVGATISPRKGRVEKTKTTKPLNVLAGPHDESVFNRNLINMRPLPQEILEHNAAFYKDTTYRNFNETVLGYVTAVNTYIYREKLTFIYH